MQTLNQARNEKDARYYFVECQLRPNHVSNPSLINAALFVNRESYLPAAYRSIAYADTCLPLSEGRWSLSPFILFRLLNLIVPQPGQKILTIGCGLGYSLALLKALGVQAYGVDENKQFCDQAAAALAENYQIIDHVRCDAHGRGWLEESPFDAIVIEGAIDQVPEVLFEQLRENGQLVAIKRRGERLCQAGVWKKIEGQLSYQPAFDVQAPLLSGFEVSPQFAL